MAEYVQEEFSYIDGGRIVRKKTWYDPETGYSWDTFDDEGPASDPTMAAGSVIDAGTLAQTGGVSRNYNPGGPETQSADGTGWTNPPGTVIPDQSPGLSSTDANSTSQSQIAAPAGSGSGGSNVAVNPLNPNLPAGGSTDPSVVNSGRNMFLYNPDQPQSAMGNVLRGMGYNLGMNNPLTNYLMRFAPGLGAAFGIQNAMGPYDPAQGPSKNLGGDFASYIQRALTGGGVFDMLNQARNQLPGAIGAIDAQLQANPSQPNPYLTSLQQILESQGGQGLAGVLSSTMAPFLTPRMAGANQQAILTGLGQRQYEYGQSDEFADPSYWFIKALLGR